MALARGPLQGTHPAALSVGLALAILLAACAGPSGPVVTLHGKGGQVQVQVELAFTPEQRSRGLMWRDHLGAARGMLFIFPDQRPRGFWMKNTPIPLDILFIDAKRSIVHIAEQTQPYSQRNIPSRRPASYVLEVNAGFCQRNTIRVGSRVELPPLAGLAVR